MKKAFGILLCFAVFSMITTTAFAANLGFSPSVAENGVVTVDVTMDAVPQDMESIASITIHYTYDETKLKYVGTVTEGDALPGLVSNPGRIVWYDATSDFSSVITDEDLVSCNNVLCTITFEKIEEAYGKADFEITFAEFGTSDYKVSTDVTVKASCAELGEKKPDDGNGDDITGGDDNTENGENNDDNSGDNNGDGGNDDNNSDNNTDNNTNNDNNGNDNNNDNSDDGEEEDDDGYTPPRGGGGIRGGNTPVVAPKPEEFPGFSDIPKDSWGYEHAYALVKRGIISGDGANMPSMRPNDNLTRAEAAKIALLAMGAEPETGLTLDFKDADTVASWAVPYIATAVKHGLITGYSDGTVGANDNISREQMLTILSRAMGWQTGGDEVSFTDRSEISPWAMDAIAYAVKSGVMTGYEDGSVKPKANITRIEVFALVNRCLSK